MPSTRSFNSRNGLTNIICDNVFRLFNPADVQIIKFGIEEITKNYERVKDYIYVDPYNEQRTQMARLYAPDYVFITNNPHRVLYLEVKTSITPLYWKSILDKIKMRHPQVRVSDVGDIAREPWNTYYNLYPGTIILEGCSYNSKLVMAQFVRNVRCLRCHTNLNINCDNCPIMNNGFFPNERNEHSEGSKTPHTNIDLSTFESAQRFFNNLNVRLNTGVLAEIRNKIAAAGISASSKNTEEQIRSVREQLILEGCTWL